jgi:acetyl-CoA acetyltransferase
MTDPDLAGGGRRAEAPGLAALCIGGGQDIAMILEAIHG